MAHTTLKAIKGHSPRENGWKKLLKHLGKTKADNEPLSLITILESNGLDDALWCLRALPPEMDSKIRLFNCDIAERALKYWDAKYPDDKRPHEVIAVSRRFANGDATQEELNNAWTAAWAVAEDPWAAVRASRVSRAAEDAARAVSWTAAWDAACATEVVAWNAACNARDSEIAEQEKLFRQYWGV